MAAMRLVSLITLVALYGTHALDIVMAPRPMPPDCGHFVERLRSVISGTVAVKGSDEWKKYYEAFQPGNSYKSAAIVLPKSATDVQAYVQACATCNVTPVVKSGGHGYGRWALHGDYPLIMEVLGDVFEVSSRSETLQIGPGTRFLDGYKQMANSSLPKHLFVGGNCPTVGLGGYMLAGGHSVWTRGFGLGADNVVAMDVVLADGRLVEASSGDPDFGDLYWALLGSGGGNFGIVTKYTMRLHEFPHGVHYSNIYYSTSSNFNAWVVAYAGYIETLDLQHTFYMSYSKVEGTPSYVLQTFTLVSRGTHSEAAAVIKGLTDALTAAAVPSAEEPHFGPDPGARTTGPYYNRTMLEYEAWIAPNMGGNTSPISFVSMSSLHDSWGEAENNIVLSAVGSSQSFFSLIPLGNLSRFSGQNAWAARNAKWLVSCDTSAIFGPAVKEKRDELYALPSRVGNFLGYMGYDEPENWQELYYGSTLSRLKQTKAKYDPGNVFNFRFSIPLATQKLLV